MSFTAPTRQRALPLLPMASMVDVLFLLLIFFMTTSVFREYDQQIAVALPATQSGQPATSPRQVVVTITADDAIYMSGQRYTLPELRGTLAELAKIAEQQSVVIRADGASRWETGVQVMDAAYAAGLTDVVVDTARQ